MRERKVLFRTSGACRPFFVDALLLRFIQEGTWGESGIKNDQFDDQADQFQDSNTIIKLNTVFATTSILLEGFQAFSDVNCK